jgi:hypothetical protein
VTAANPPTHIVAYFDDINVAGLATAAAQAFEALSTEVRNAGLTHVASKSAAESSDQDMAVAASAGLGILHACDKGYRVHSVRKVQ